MIAQSIHHGSCFQAVWVLAQSGALLPSIPKVDLASIVVFVLLKTVAMTKRFYAFGSCDAAANRLKSFL